MNVTFFELDVKARIGYRRKLRRWLEGVVTSEQGDVKQVNFVFCSDSKLLEINQRYLGHNYYTDVIAFSLSAPGESVEGDICISVDRVTENAASVQASEVDEMHRVMVHGLLHLLGYNDQDDNSKDQMRAKEDRYLGEYQLSA